jgi:hypothetical protein
MNERIKLLAEQAGMILGDAGEFDMAKFMPKEVKFAQLIVRECADIAKGEPANFSDRDPYKIGRRSAGIDVLKLFGVEE